MTIPPALACTLAIFAVAAVTPAQTFTTIHQFRGAPTDGARPGLAGSLAASGDLMVGITVFGGTSGGGVVFSLSPPASPGQPWAETVLYNFAGGTDGLQPQALAIGSGGIIYGTTFRGGTQGYGTAFSLTPPAAAGSPWTHTVIYNFQSLEDPSGALNIDGHGVIYGISEQGGATNNGTVYSLTPPASPAAPWTKTTLHKFHGSDGSKPTGGVAIGSDGVLYGATFESNTNAIGVIFSLTPPAWPGGEWAYQTLADTSSPGGSANPAGGVVIGPGGTLYGTLFDSTSALNQGDGSVFSITPPSSAGDAWTYAIIYQFGTGAPCTTDGAGPQAPLVVGPGGVLYGVTAAGGDGRGTIFSLAPPAQQGGAWTETVLYRFTNASDGSFPGCVILSNQSLFGVADDGSTDPAGSVWTLTP